MTDHSRYPLGVRANVPQPGLDHHHVPRGALVVLTIPRPISADDAGDAAAQLHAQLQAAVPHDEWACLVLVDTALQVWPDGESVGADLIARERTRQATDEDYTAAHDLAHPTGMLLEAALAYATHLVDEAHAVDLWPFDPADWKPAGGLRDLVRAGALIAAEIDRRLADHARGADHDQG